MILELSTNPIKLTAIKKVEANRLSNHYLIQTLHQTSRNWLLESIPKLLKQKDPNYIYN